MCHEYGIKRQTYSTRRRKGWSIEEALTIPTSRWPVLQIYWLSYWEKSILKTSYSMSLGYK